jgi:hypothetical protein
MPFDLVPDFIPVAGQEEDAILVAATIAYTVHRAGREVIEELWPGSERGLRVVLALAASPHPERAPNAVEFSQRHSVTREPGQKPRSRGDPLDACGGVESNGSRGWPRPSPQPFGTPQPGPTQHA